MFEFIKKNIFIILIFIITLCTGFITFLTFIDKSFIELNDKNLQLLLFTNLILNILLPFSKAVTHPIFVLMLILFMIIYYNIKKIVNKYIIIIIRSINEY